jgi:ubiquinone/menaquinone biosynthesis C-methylase UbiE
MSSSQYYSKIRTDLLQLLPKNIKLERTLDVGCGAGGTSELLKKEFGAKYTVGLEVVEKAAEQATERLDQVYKLSAESKELPFDANEFDLILFADVLEHLVDPWNALHRFSEFLKPGGHVIISLPNIQNWKILLKLFLGRWEYADFGIMDRTHLRFFTVKSAVAMTSNAGFRVEKLQRTMGKVLSFLNVLTFGLFRNHLTYHIYLLGKK